MPGTRAATGPQAGPAIGTADGMMGRARAAVGRRRAAPPLATARIKGPGAAARAFNGLRGGLPRRRLPRRLKGDGAAGAPAPARRILPEGPRPAKTGAELSTDGKGPPAHAGGPGPSAPHAPRPDECGRGGRRPRGGRRAGKAKKKRGPRGPRSAPIWKCRPPVSGALLSHGLPPQYHRRSAA